MASRLRYGFPFVRRLDVSVAVDIDDAIAVKNISFTSLTARCRQLDSSDRATAQQRQAVGPMASSSAMIMTLSKKLSTALPHLAKVARLAASRRVCIAAVLGREGAIGAPVLSGRFTKRASSTLWPVSLALRKMLPTRLLAAARLGAPGLWQRHAARMRLHSEAAGTPPAPSTTARSYCCVNWLRYRS